MKVLEIHNFHRKGSASGDDQVFKSETALLENYRNYVVKYTVSNDAFDNVGVIGKRLYEESRKTGSNFWNAMEFQTLQSCETDYKE